MSEIPGDQPNDSISTTPLEGHSKEKEAGFLARLLGFSIGRKQAGAAEPDVKELAKRVKELGPDVVDQAIESAIASYRQRRQEEEAKKPSIKPEE